MRILDCILRMRSIALLEAENVREKDLTPERNRMRIAYWARYELARDLIIDGLETLGVEVVLSHFRHLLRMVAYVVFLA